MALFPSLGSLAVRCVLVAAVAGVLGASGGRVIEVRNGHTFVLEDNRVVRLKAVQAPTERTVAAGLAEASKRALARWVRGKEILFDRAQPEMDRYARLLAFVRRSDGVDIQATLVRDGHVWVRSYPGDRAKVAGLLAVEAEARTARRGVWAPEHRLVVSPDGAWSALDGFRIVEGTVRAAAKVRNRVYLNFGDDWRDDFTIRLDRRYWRAFRKIGLDPMRLEGRRVRVRGWVILENGPMIRLDHAAPLQLLP